VWETDPTVRRKKKSEPKNDFDIKGNENEVLKYGK
jgi:hypothetical protein